MADETEDCERQAPDLARSRLVNGVAAGDQISEFVIEDAPVAFGMLAEWTRIAQTDVAGRRRT